MHFIKEKNKKESSRHHVRLFVLEERKTALIFNIAKQKKNHLIYKIYGRRTSYLSTPAALLKLLKKG